MVIPYVRKDMKQTNTTYICAFSILIRYLIPKGKSSIRSYCCQCSMSRMKCNIIHSINILETICNTIRTMTFECKVIFWVLSIYILDSNSPFYTSQCKTCVRNRKILYRVSVIESLLYFPIMGLPNTLYLLISPLPVG